MQIQAKSQQILSEKQKFYQRDRQQEGKGAAQKNERRLNDGSIWLDNNEQYMRTERKVQEKKIRKKMNNLCLNLNQATQNIDKTHQKGSKVL